MNTFETEINKLIESQVDVLLHDDDYYNAKTSPLISGAEIKKKERDALTQSLKKQMNDLHKDLLEAQTLIFKHLPALTSQEEFNKIKEELDHSSEHLMEYASSLMEGTNKPVRMQEIFGISNETLSHIYHLTYFFVEHKEYHHAQSLLVFLTIMAPHINEFWISYGICLQALEKNEEAIQLYSIIQQLFPEDPAAFIYQAESYLKLNDSTNAKKNIDLIQPLLKEKKEAAWKESLNFVNRALGYI